MGAASNSTWWGASKNKRKKRHLDTNIFYIWVLVALEFHNQSPQIVLTSKPPIILIIRFVRKVRARASKRIRKIFLVRFNSPIWSTSVAVFQLAGSTRKWWWWNANAAHSILTMKFCVFVLKEIIYINIKSLDPIVADLMCVRDAIILDLIHMSSTALAVIRRKCHVLCPIQHTQGLAHGYHYKHCHRVCKLKRPQEIAFATYLHTWWPLQLLLTTIGCTEALAPNDDDDNETATIRVVSEMFAFALYSVCTMAQYSW